MISLPSVSLLLNSRDTILHKVKDKSDIMPRIRGDATDYSLMISRIAAGFCYHPHPSIDSGQALSPFPLACCSHLPGKPWQAGVGAGQGRGDCRAPLAMTGESKERDVRARRLLRDFVPRNDMEVRERK